MISFTYKYKLKPTKKQIKDIEIYLDICRAVYNCNHGERKDWIQSRKNPIVSIACEEPSESGRPISHWSRRELKAEAVKRGIVDNISPRTVGRFLKGSHLTASSLPLLAQSAKRQ